MSRDDTDAENSDTDFEIDSRLDSDNDLDQDDEPQIGFIESDAEDDPWDP